MKKLLSAFFAMAMFGIADAQVKTPQASPSAEIEQIVGLTKIEIEYSRPAKRNRTIFGNIVPYGEVWRTGANKNTTIEFSDDVTISERKLKAGKYAIYTKPEQDGWTFYFYTDNENWGNPEKWDESKIALQFTTKVQKPAAPIESFTISLDDLTAGSAMLNFGWENVKTGFKVTVPTNDIVMKSIKETMRAQPKYQDYIAAANYFYETKEDLQQAKTWMDEGMRLNPNPAYYQIYQQALIHMEAGDTKGALKFAQDAAASAKKAGSKEYEKYASELAQKLSK